MKIFVINIGKLFLRVLYYFMKLSPTKKQIVMLSRESNTPPVDFILLKKELEKTMPDYDIVMLCELLSSSGASPVSIFKNTLKSMKLLSVSRCCVLDTYSLPVSVLNHKKELKVVQIWHALGGLKLSGYEALDKSGGHSSKVSKALCMHKNYDVVTASSETVKELYAGAFGCDKAIIKILGMPRIDYILSDSDEKKERTKRLIEAHPLLNNGKKTILYVPTFRENKDIYLAEMLDNIDFLRYNLAVKAHVIDKTRALPENVIELSESLFDVFGAVDYIITDYSAASIEASLTGKPLYFYTYDIDEYQNERGLFINPLTEYSSIASKSFEKIYLDIEAGSYDYKALDSFKSRMVETYDTDNTKRIAKVIREMAK